MESSRRLAEIAAMKDENYKLGHTITFFTNLLKDPAALSEYREAVRLEQEEKRQLQTSSGIRRQVVTFDGCLFKNNTYGEKSDITNYGVISTVTFTGDIIVKESIFEYNDFGNKDIDVSLLSCLRNWRNRATRGLLVASSDVTGWDMKTVLTEVVSSLFAG